ncbi:MAG: sigma-70 family RNA polymerase sigma factor [Candidatus Hydrogenedentes bacterium]|nr:sigma-70 family RNA polymerase sigma factor [Candidatus Hydrogenedentota bacterium]
MISILPSNDARLVKRTLRGRREAFSPLVTKYQQLVFAIAYGMLGNTADAEDVTQDAFLTAFKRLPDLREPAKFRPWLLQIARNRASDVIVRRRRETPLEGAELPAPGDPDNHADTELRALLRERVEGLPPEHREILLLHYYAGLKVREIAEQLEISTEAAKKRLQRARDILSQRMLAQLRDTVEEQGSSAARSRKIIGLIAGATVPWLGTSAAAAGAGMLTTAVLVKTGAATVIVAGIVSVTLIPVRNGQPPTPPASNTPEAASAAPQTAPDSAAEQSGDPVSTLASAESASPAIAPASGDGIVHGRVVDHSDHPIPNLLVTANTVDADLGARHEAISDSNGRFVIEGLQDGQRYLLQAVAQDAYGLSEATARSDRSQVRERTLKLLQSSDLTGAVTDVDGNPIVGAEIRPYVVRVGEDVRVFTDAMKQFFTVHTDENGKFVLRHAWVGHWRADVDSREHVFRRIEFRHPEETPREIQLQPGATVAGRVVYSGTDTGVPGIVLELHEDRFATTDATGSFSIAGVASPSNIVDLPSHPNLVVTSPPFAVFPGRLTDGVRVEVRSGGRISGQIRDGRTGTPIPNSDVTLREGRRVWSDSVMADENGFYSFAGLHPGEYRPQRVMGNGYIPLEFEEAEPIQIEYGTVIEHLDFELDSGVSLAGNVEFPESSTWEDARLEVRLDAGGYRSIPILRDGSFRADGISPDWEIKVQISGGGWTSDLVGPFRVSREDLPDLQLTARRATTGSIQGQVVRGGWQPCADVEVVLRDEHGREIQRSISDGSGFFHFASVYPGAYTASILGAGQVAQRVAVQPGESSTLAPLEYNSGNGEISGRVLDAHGAPITGAQVRASGTPERIPVAETDGDGRYTLKGLGTYPAEVTVRAERYARASAADVIPGSQNVNFRLNRLGSVDGRVIDATTGDPVEMFHIQAVPSHDASQIEQALRGHRYGLYHSSAKGEFFASNLPPGEQTVIARAPGFFPGQTATVVRSGETRSGLTIRLLPAPAARVQVVDASGGPVSGACVFVHDVPHLFDNTRASECSHETNDEGIAKLDDLLPGVNTLFVYHPVKGRLAVTTEARARNEPVQLALPPSAELSGRATYNGKPIRDDQLKLSVPSVAGPRYFWSYKPDLREDGSYAFSGLMSGEATVVLDSIGARLERNIHIAPGSNTLDLNFRDGSARITLQPVLPEYLADAQIYAIVTVDATDAQTSLYGAPNAGRAITLENVPPGRATLLLSVQLDRDQSAGKVVHRDIGEGETLVETMDFTAGANITGEVLQGGAASAEFGRLVAGTLERPVESSEDMNELYRWTLQQQRIGPGGTFRFGAVEPGTYTVVVLDGDASVIAQQTVTVADTDIDVKVRVP